MTLRVHLSHRVLLAGVLLLLACRAPERDDHIADEIPAEEAQPMSEDPGQGVVVDDPDYRARLKATGTYQDCMKKREGLEKPQADLIAKACGNMPDAPKSK
ncbi:MAG TPA: hypothetical protein VFZ04_21545 [Longimicrobiales bacterium]